MKQIPIQEAKPEMVLAKNVYGSNDNFLMGKGITLNADNIAQLSRLGVQILSVEGPNGKSEMSGEDIEKITKEVEELLNAQFEKVSQNPIMKELKRIFTNSLIKKRTT